jgi:hypothetical protein
LDVEVVLFLKSAELARNAAIAFPKSERFVLADAYPACPFLLACVLLNLNISPNATPKVQHDLSVPRVFFV